VRVHKATSFELFHDDRLGLPCQAAPIPDRQPSLDAKPDTPLTQTEEQQPATTGRGGAEGPELVESTLVAATD